MLDCSWLGRSNIKNPLNLCPTHLLITSEISIQAWITWSGWGWVGLLGSGLELLHTTPEQHTRLNQGKPWCRISETKYIITHSYKSISTHMDFIFMGWIKQVLPALTAIRDSELEFANGELHYFDTIIFATGFRRSIDCWLKVLKSDS